MSLGLTALRLQAVAALNSHPVIARLCDGRVYDSQIGDFDHRQPVPVIVVTTEELHGDGLSANNGGTPFEDACDLVLEVMMCATEGADGETAVVNPVTDRELEAVLNLIAWCAETMLTLGRPHPANRSTPEGRLLLAAVTRRVTKRTVSRFSTDQAGVKLALHLITFRVEVKGDDRGDARSPPSGPYAALPNPLRSVCEAAPEGSSAEGICRLLVAALPPVPVPRDAPTVTFALNLTPVPAPNAGTPATAQFPLDGSL
ncbi:hypothetical protein [uncultured Methylobacterium sp.]|uniref:hypothetical protein n=1 Tax=uncultured Methylobacterium sp. TaxID=157278 RepID=UPI0035C97E6B